MSDQHPAIIEVAKLVDDLDGYKKTLAINIQGTHNLTEGHGKELDKAYKANADLVAEVERGMTYRQMLKDAKKELDIYRRNCAAESEAHLETKSLLAQAEKELHGLRAVIEGIRISRKALKPDLCEKCWGTGNKLCDDGTSTLCDCLKPKCPLCENSGLVFRKAPVGDFRYRCPIGCKLKGE